MTDEIKCSNCGELNPASENECGGCRANLLSQTSQAPELQEGADWGGLLSGPAATATAETGNATPPVDQHAGSVTASTVQDSVPVPVSPPAPGPTTPPVPQPAVTGPVAAGSGKISLEVEGFREVIFKGKRTKQIEITMQEMQIGRCDPANGHYPQIDLREIAREDPDVKISRRHARLVEEQGAYYLEDLGGNETTYVQEPGGGFEMLAQAERRELKPGTRFMLGDGDGAVVFKVNPGDAP